MSHSIGQCRNLSHVFEGCSSRCWAGFAMNTDQKAHRRYIHNAKDYLEALMASKAQGGGRCKEVEKKMRNLSVEIDGETVASIFKGRFTWRAASAAFLTEAEKQEGEIAALS